MVQKIEWGPVGWVEQLVPNSAGASVLTVAGDPSSGLVFPATFASRTSDGGGIGDMAISMNDLPTRAAGAWGRYTEAWVGPKAHPDSTQFGHEYAIINLRGTCADVTPGWPNTPGAVVGVRIGIGKDPKLGSGEISALQSLVNVDGFGNPRAVARKGIVFHAWVLKFIKGIAEAISLAKGHAIAWYDSTDRRGVLIHSDLDNANYGVGVKFTNGALHLYNLRTGDHHFSFNTETGALYLGTGAIGPNGTIRLFAGGKSFLLAAKPE